MFEKVLNSSQSSRQLRIFYVFVASGLCGSITSFSTWALEVNKLLLIQMDYSNELFSQVDSHQGGWILEWFTSWITGISAPLCALWCGQHVGELVNAILARKQCCVPPAPLCHERCTEVALVASYIASTLVLIIVPHQYGHDSIPCSIMLGAAGAYLRYKLSRLNSIESLKNHFRLGTFVANVLGTALLAVVMILSKLHVSYHDDIRKNVLYGLSTGFCG